VRLHLNELAARWQWSAWYSAGKVDPIPISHPVPVDFDGARRPRPQSKLRVGRRDPAGTRVPEENTSIAGGTEDVTELSVNSGRRESEGPCRPIGPLLASFQRRPLERLPVGVRKATGEAQDPAVRGDYLIIESLACMMPALSR
jgi:hypothetical protein